MSEVMATPARVLYIEHTCAHTYHTHKMDPPIFAHGECPASKQGKRCESESTLVQNPRQKYENQYVHAVYSSNII